MRRSSPVLSLLALAGAVGVAATAATGSDPGIADGTILVGGTASLSGPDAASGAVARGAAAYLGYVNARGGVNGRTVVYRVVDDGSDPVRALAATQRLVEQDRVFAIVNSAGTEQNLAARDYLNAAQVPQLFAASGATALGRDFRQYPWTIGFRPSDRAEGWIYGAYLARARPRAKVGVLFQDDELGRELLAGLRQGIRGSSARVVAAEPYDPAATDVRPQLETLAASGADVLALFATQRQALPAYELVSRLRWRPAIVASESASATNVLGAAVRRGAASTVEGAVSVGFVKDPAEPAWRDDRGVKLYRTIMSRYAKGANPSDARQVYGMAVAYELVKVLQAAGSEPTRAAVMAQARKLNDPSNPFLLPGIVVRTGVADRFPVEQAQLRRWSKGRWRSSGGLWAAAGAG